MASLWDDALDPLTGRAIQPPEQAKGSLWETALLPYLQDVFSGRKAMQGLEALQPTQPYTPGQSLASMALDPQAQEQAQNVAIGFSGGGMATKGLPRLSARPAPENVGETISANFEHGVDMGHATVSLDKLNGGVNLLQPEQRARIDLLKQQMSGPDGYIARPIVDTEGNVIEGQHRVEALRELGHTDVPVHLIKDLEAGLDTAALKDAISQAQRMHSDTRHQLIGRVLEALHDQAGSPAKVLAEYDAPSGYQAGWNAALNEIARQRSGRGGGI